MAAIDIVLLYIRSETSLGCILSVSPVSGGFMHKMYKLETERGTYALKLLDPTVMARPDAADNYDRAETLEDMIAESGVNVCRALVINGKKRQYADGQYFYLFDWIDGAAVRWGAVTPYHADKAGALLGSIHNIIRHAECPRIDPVNYDWHALVETAITTAPDVANAVAANADMLSDAAEEYNDAVLHLPHIVTVTNGDLDPKNVLWTGDDAEHLSPVIIDLESLDFGSPYSDAWILAMSWSGGPACRFDVNCFRAFIDAYRRTTHFYIDAEALYGLGYSWLNWLGYNIKRAAGECGADAVALGRSESMATLDRIKFYRESKSLILRTAEM